MNVVEHKNRLIGAVGQAEFEIAQRRFVAVVAVEKDKVYGCA
jgi:hypothetical protein